MAGEILPRKDGLLAKDNMIDPLIKKAELDVRSSLRQGATEAANLLLSPNGTPDKKPVGQYNAENFGKEISSKVLDNMNARTQLEQAKEKAKEEAKEAEQAKKKDKSKQKWNERIDKIKSLFTGNDKQSKQSGVTKDDFSL